MLSFLEVQLAALAATTNYHGCGQSEIPFRQVDRVLRCSTGVDDLSHRAIMGMVLNVSLSAPATADPYPNVISPTLEN